MKAGSLTGLRGMGKKSLTLEQDLVHFSGKSCSDVCLLSKGKRVLVLFLSSWELSFCNADSFFSYCALRESCGVLFSLRSQFLKVLGY